MGRASSSGGEGAKRGMAGGAGAEVWRGAGPLGLRGSGVVGCGSEIERGQGLWFGADL